MVWYKATKSVLPIFSGVFRLSRVQWPVPVTHRPVEAGETHCPIQIQARLSSAKEIRDGHLAQLAEVKENIKIESAARPDSESRSQALARLAELRKQVVALENELGAYGDCDPVKIEETKRAVFLAKEAALRWTGAYALHLSSWPSIANESE
ncbi:hypothetical protein DXG03_002064 [Asterophora parasitica]|uniref:Uncharacterized protein n=1 Tax=Asterophora parasitica TaxID=117018 RepID=A0A9P7G3C0_9AGAR|nr:hypothetical protein DXG03_002064 [Asterophora parasitica]